MQAQQAPGAISGQLQNAQYKEQYVGGQYSGANSNDEQPDAVSAAVAAQVAQYNKHQYQESAVFGQRMSSNLRKSAVDYEQEYEKAKV